MKYIGVIFIILVFAGSIVTSCKYTPSDHNCDTCGTDTTHHCDTCNLNRDSLQRIKDSLAHAFTWTEYINKISGETNLTGVWVFGQDDILVVANSLYHFDGTNFQLVHTTRNQSGTTLDGGLSGFNIFAFSKNNFWMVHGSIAFYTTDGTFFTDYRPGSSNACWGSAPNDVFVVGNGGQIHHWDGTSFTQMTSNTTKDIGQVWGTSSSNVWASGWNPNTTVSVLLHYDGNSWSEIDLSKLGEIGVGKHALISVWACDSASRHITFAAGSFLYKTIDNSLWKSDTLKNGFGGGSYAGLNKIRGNSSTDLMVQGAGGFITHWNGKTWFFYDKLFNWGDPSYDINAFSFNGNTACMVGYKDGQGYMAVGQRK